MLSVQIYDPRPHACFSKLLNLASGDVPNKLADKLRTKDTCFEFSRIAVVYILPLALPNQDRQVVMRMMANTPGNTPYGSVDGQKGKLHRTWRCLTLLS